MHCIVANELDKRYNEVTIFQKRERKEAGEKTAVVDSLRLLRDPNEEDIEKQLVDDLKRRHEEHAKGIEN